MPNQNPLDDHMKNRINNIFSGQELPTYASLSEVEAMKNRIAELEKELAGQQTESETPLASTSEKDSVEKSMPALQLQKNLANAEESASHHSGQKQVALWMARIFTGVGLAFLIFSVYTLLVSEGGHADASDFALMPLTVLMVIASFVGFRLIRRDRFNQGVWAMYLVDVILPPILAALSTKNIYFLVGGYLIIFSLLFINLVIPRSSTWKAIIAAIAAALAVFAIEVWNPGFRAGTNHLETFTPVVIALTLLAVLTFIIRQAATGSINTKLISAFVVVAILSMGVVAYQADRSLRNSLTSEIIDNQVFLATSEGFQIGQAINGQYDKLKGLATLKTIQTGTEAANQDEARPKDVNEIESISLAWRAAVKAKNTSDPLVIKVLYNPLSTQLRKFQKTFPENVEILLTDDKGFSIASTDLPANYYQADTLWWRTAHTTGQYIGQPILDPSTNSIALDMAIPIYSYNSGDFVGVLRATVNFNVLTDLLVEALHGQTGYSIIYQPNDQQLKLQPTADGAYTIAQSFASTDLQNYLKSSTPSSELNLDGTPVLASLAPVKSYTSVLPGEGTSALDSLAWQVVVVQDKSEALQPVTAQTRTNLILVIFIIIAVMAISYFLASFITNPIIHLTAVATQLGLGDLSAKAKVETRDEIGTLATTFNRMASQLRETLLGLEVRVADRTHDLELASEVGQAITEKIADLSALLSDAAETIRNRFNLYYTQIYLIDPAGRTLNLRAGTGEAGRELLHRGHHLEITSASLNGRAVIEQRPVLVDDAENSSNFLPNPLLPLTRSELTIPLIAGGNVVGVLDMQAERSKTFNKENIPAFQVLAGQLAIAIQNSTLFKQADEARVVVEEQARRLTHTGWQEYLDGLERSEKIGYAYNQNEILPINELKETPFENTLVVPIQITGTKVGQIQLSDEKNRTWTAAEKEIIQAAVANIAQHIENLRLISQADKYRLEAEQVTRRLTLEGWSEYLTTRKNLAEGFIYENNKVQPLAADKVNGKATQSYPIYIRDEHIGDLAVDAKDGDQQDINDLLSIVTQQLSSHIENLRLLEQSQDSRLKEQQSQARSQTILESVTIPMVITRLKDNILTFINKPATEVVKVKYEEAIDQPAPNFYYDVEERTRFVTELRTNGSVSNMTVQLLRGGKEKFWALISARLFEYQGEQSILTTFMDITDRIVAQEAVIKRAAELQTVAEVSITTATTLEPDRLLQTVVDLSKEKFGLYHAHIYLTDESSNMLLLMSGAGETGRQMAAAGHSISMEAERSLVARATRERQAIIVNDVYREPDFLPNPMLPETRAEMAVPMIVGDRVVGVFDVQARTINRFTQEDASIFTTLASQVAIALQNARSYVEQAATVTQLRELDKLKSSFLANMSHELRTPLNSILGFTDVMLEELDGPLTPNMDNDLKLIQKNGKHLLHLINDVLDMAKIESGKMNLMIEKFNLNEAIEDVMSITSSLANEKSIKLFIEPESDKNVFIRADHTRLRQVLINLINNGVKFTDEGSVSIRVTLDDNDVNIVVRDTGIGIPIDHLDTVFQEFTQVDSTTTRKSGGTGLGLPISRRLIEMHGGKLWAESNGENGHGTTFHVLLPVEAVVSEAAVSEPFEKK